MIILHSLCMLSRLIPGKQQHFNLTKSRHTRGYTKGGGRNRGVNLPSPYFLSQFLPPPYFFEPIPPSSLNGFVSFSPFSQLFPHISPSSQPFLGHFSLLPILFLPPPKGLVAETSPTNSSHEAFCATSRSDLSQNFKLV